MSYLLKYSVMKRIRLMLDLGSDSITNFGQIS